MLLLVIQSQVPMMKMTAPKSEFLRLVTIEHFDDHQHDNLKPPQRNLNSDSRAVLHLAMFIASTMTYSASLHSGFQGIFHFSAPTMNVLI